LKSDLENLFSNIHLRVKYLWQISLKSLHLVSVNGQTLAGQWITDGGRMDKGRKQCLC